MYISHTLGDSMTKRRYTFWIDERQAAGLRQVKDMEGIAESEQIRSAIRDYLRRKGMQSKAERKRVTTRKRP